MGFAASHHVWAPQLADLLAAPAAATGEAPPQQQGKQQEQQQQKQQQQQQGQASPMVVCVLDNRGVGRSSSPTERRDYSTAAMAADALQVRQGHAPPLPLLSVSRLLQRLLPRGLAAYSAAAATC
jgi:hypothetical protein